MIRLGTIVIVLALAAPPVPRAEEPYVPRGNPNYHPVPPKYGYTYPDCYCTDSFGQRVEIGELACLKIGSREVLARCDTSVNLTTWRTVHEGCPGV